MIRTILKIVIPLVIIIISFIYNIFLGFLSLVLYVAYMFYTTRANLFLLIGNLQFQKGNLESAKKWTEKACNTEPNNLNMLIAYGYLLLKLGETDHADDIFSKAPVTHISRENEMNLKINKSIVLWKQGKQDESIELATEVYEKFKNSVLYGTLGYYYVLKGDLDKALQFNEEAYEYSDNNTAIVDNLGLTYYKLGNYDKAFEIYEKLMLLNPKFSEAYYNYGLLYEQRGEWKQAHDYFKRSLDYKESLVSHMSREEVLEKISTIENMHQVEG